MSDIDILQQMDNIDVSKVETSFPIPAEGLVRARVTSAKREQEPNKKKGGTNTFFEFEFAFTQDWRTQPINGNPSSPIPVGGRGSKMTKRVYVGQYEKKDGSGLAWYGIEELAKLRESALGKAPAGTSYSNLCDDVLGQEVTLVLKFDPAPKNKDTGEVYGPRTEITNYVAKKTA